MNNTHHLLNINYSKPSALKRIFSIYHTVGGLAMSGQSDAIAIKLDVEAMLKDDVIISKQKAQAIKRYYLEGYTQPEIAETLGVTQVAVSYLVNSGIKELCKYWSNLGE